MRRRSKYARLVGTALRLGPPLAVCGPLTQGLLSHTRPQAAALQALRDDLARLGWRDGAKLRPVHRASDARHEQLDAAVDDLLASRSRSRCCCVPTR